jgi:anion-transporting  ArsA/GET3 family ATPase
MDTTIQSIRSEVQETIHNGVEKVREELNQKTEAIHIELTDEIDKTKLELQTVEEDIAAIKEDITANKEKVQSQIEQVKAIAERGGRQIVSSNTAQAPTFDGKTSWSTFWRQFETVAEHNVWSAREKSTYLITALKGRAADVLAGIPINTAYEDTLQTLEDRFGDQHFAAAYRCQLTTRKQKAGESLQEFATAIELLAHRASPTLPEDHIGREAAKAFARCLTQILYLKKALWL